MDRGFEHALIEHDLDTHDLRLRTLVTDRYRITHYAGQPYGELYDLKEDPDEFVNLWDTDLETRKALLVQLLDEVSGNIPWEPPKISHA